MQKKKLYQRGDYYLAQDRKRDGKLRSKNFYIFWYDSEARRSVSRSTSTADLGEAKEELDRLYDEQTKGHQFCPTCGQAFSGEPLPLLATAIAEYLQSTTYEAARPRLSQVLSYLEDRSLEEVRCDEINDAWISKFRTWAMAAPIVTPAGLTKKRTPGTVEGSVRMVRAAIDKAYVNRKLPHRASFVAKAATVVSKTPWFRASESQLIAMFRYALVLDPPKEATEKQIAKWRRERANLLQYLRLGVSTWARPDAIMDFSTDPQRGQ